ncbi:MAG: amino acid adenylation domain-containing protein [Actinomycetota bacterium]
MTRTYLVHQLLERSAAEHPDRIAVADRGAGISYAELDRLANQIAHLLQELGVGPGERVGIYLDKSIHAVTAIYAVLKAGGAYVPLDPHAPPARLATILGDARAVCLISETAMSGAWRDLIAGETRPEHLVVVDAPNAAALPSSPWRSWSWADAEGRPVTPPTSSVIGADLAYILYTSGSTGVPKGVMLTHTNALAFVEWAADTFGISCEDRLSSHAPFHFDLSVFDLFAAAAGGAAVVLVPADAAVFPVEVARFIRREGITVWYSVPSALSVLTVRGGLSEGDLPDLRTVLFAGEVFPTKYLRRLMKLLPLVRFGNLYGPTETNVCTWYDVPPLPEDADDPIPIGRAIEGDEVFAVTEDGRVAADGETGELFVRGATVMAGYWEDPEKTQQVLVPNPVSGSRPGLVYRTGDLVRRRADGVYQFLGRRDAQVKTRGYRVELGEIESAIYAHPAVEECAVVAVPDELVTTRIKAFVVTRQRLGQSELAAFCIRRIPRYMVPETVEFRSSLPKTSTGKVDRQALRTAARAVS